MFKTGDRVRNRHNGQEGTVLSVEPEQRGRCLVVQWDEGTFWLQDLKERVGHQLLVDVETIEP